MVVIRHPDDEGRCRGHDVRAASRRRSTDSAVTMLWPPSDLTLATRQLRGELVARDDRTGVAEALVAVDDAGEVDAGIRSGEQLGERVLLDDDGEGRRRDDIRVARGDRGVGVEVERAGREDGARRTRGPSRGRRDRARLAGNSRPCRSGFTGTRPKFTDRGARTACENPGRPSWATGVFGWFSR